MKVCRRRIYTPLVHPTTQLCISLTMRPPLVAFAPKNNPPPKAQCLWRGNYLYEAISSTELITYSKRMR